MHPTSPTLSLPSAPLRAGPFATRRVQARDADEHAHNLSGWDQQYDQLAPGSFAGELAEFWVDSVQVFRERTSHAVRQTCRIRDDAVWCGIPVVHDGTRIGGRTVGADGVMLRAGGMPFELLTPSGHDIFGVVARRAALEAHAEAVGCRIDAAALAEPGWWRVGDARRGLALARLGSLLDGALDAGLGDAPAPAATRRLRESVLDVLVELLEAPSAAPRGTAGFERHRRLVEAVCDAVRAEPDAVPTVPELCARFHVSRRALQYAFEDVLGTSPLAWLRILRLNAVRRDLATARRVDEQMAGTPRTVGEIASAHGFWNLSQFAVDYRKLFGERPSQTLMRAAL